ncbi:hypothetical protein FQA39_LY13669 [Lamprigera yunnana]|nr:hypothetical protein FQA39_LY13669 [Lamprigera yunnana]
MKINIIVLIYFLTGVVINGQEEQIERYVKAIKKCKIKYNLNSDVLSALDEGGKSVQSFCECILQEQGCINNNGELLYEEIKKIPFFGIPSDKMSTFVDQCKTEEGASTAETSYKFTKCMFLTYIKYYREQQKQNKMLQG